MLNTWISGCDESHTDCVRLLQEAPLPTRVVQILGKERVRLRVTNGEEGRYTSVSHCWGTEGVTRTTIGSLSAYQTSIPWTELSLTFQDAIDLTWRLGIEYIWIDSLCIVQVSIFPMMTTGVNIV